MVHYGVKEIEIEPQYFGWSPKNTRTGSLGCLLNFAEIFTVVLLRMLVLWTYGMGEGRRVSSPVTPPPSPSFCLLPLSFVPPGGGPGGTS